MSVNSPTGMLSMITNLFSSNEKNPKFHPVCSFWFLTQFPFQPEGTAINIQEDSITFDLPSGYNSTYNIFDYPSIKRSLITPSSRNDITKHLPDLVTRMMAYFPPPDLTSIVDSMPKDNAPDPKVEPKIKIKDTIDTENTKLNRLLNKLSYLEDPTAIPWYVILQTIILTQEHYNLPTDPNIDLTENDLKTDFSTAAESSWSLNENVKKLSPEDKDLATALHKIVLLIKQNFFHHEHAVKTVSPLNDISAETKNKIFDRTRFMSLNQTCIQLYQQAPDRPTMLQDYTKVKPHLKVLETEGMSLIASCNQLLIDKRKAHEDKLRFA